MATDTLSTTFSAIYLGLTEPPDDILSRLELCNIVTRRLSYRLEQIRQSEQAISIAKTANFTLGADEDEIDLTDEVDDFVVPMWAEVQVTTYINNPVWSFIPTVNLSMLQQQRALGLPGVAFHGENSKQVLATFSFYGNEMYMNSPFNQIRVWYLPTFTEPSTEEETINLPQNLVSILVYDSFVSAIPIMRANAAKQFDRNPQLRDQVAEWDKLELGYRQERSEFETLWDKWCKESRGAHRARRRGDVLPRVIGRNVFPWAQRNGS